MGRLSFLWHLLIIKCPLTCVSLEDSLESLKLFLNMKGGSPSLFKWRVNTDLVLVTACTSCWQLGGINEKSLCDPCWLITTDYLLHLVAPAHSSEVAYTSLRGNSYQQTESSPQVFYLCVLSLIHRTSFTEDYHRISEYRTSKRHLRASERVYAKGLLSGKMRNSVSNTFRWILPLKVQNHFSSRNRDLRTIKSTSAYQKEYTDECADS